MIKKYTLEEILETYGKAKKIDWRGFILRDGTIIEMGKYTCGVGHDEIFYDDDIRSKENLVCYNYRVGDLSLKMIERLSKKQFNVIMKNVFHDFNHRRMNIDVHYDEICSSIKTNIKHNFSNNEEDKKHFENLLMGICEIED